MNYNLPLFTNLKSDLVAGIEKIHQFGVPIFAELLRDEDDQANMTRLSILKILLQALRLSASFYKLYL